MFEWNCDAARNCSCSQEKGEADACSDLSYLCLGIWVASFYQNRDLLWLWLLLFSCLWLARLPSGKYHLFFNPPALGKLSRRNGPDQPVCENTLEGSFWSFTESWRHLYLQWPTSDTCTGGDYPWYPVLWGAPIIFNPFLFYWRKT